MSTALVYHQATKYAPDTIGGHPGLDWASQPAQTKDYEPSRAVDLAAWLPFDPNPFTGEAAGPEALVASVGLAALSRLIYATYGITGIIHGDRPTYLRAAPSAGGLYPAELYVVIRDFPTLAPGLYGYLPQRHALIPLWEDPTLADHLAQACYGSAAVAAAPFSLVVTGIFERSRWRYQERAYRRINLDTGHLLGNAQLAAHALGWRSHLTAAFADDALNTLLRVDPAEEGALAVLAINNPGSLERPAWAALPSPVGSSHPTLPLLDALHAAGRCPKERPRLPLLGDATAEALHLRHGWATAEHLESTGQSPLSRDVLSAIADRRSTRAFSGAPMPREALARILAAAYAPERVGLGPAGHFALDQLMTFVAVRSVSGLEPGVYYLAPTGLELRLVRAGCDARALAFLGLGQDLCGLAAAVVLHAADLSAAVQRYGDRVYRLLHLDAGILGQRLNLAALAEGQGASGIGGFFDDKVSDMLGIPHDQAVVYLTVLGAPSRV